MALHLFRPQADLGDIAVLVPDHCNEYHNKATEMNFLVSQSI